jgi:hypothetical protein
MNWRWRRGHPATRQRDSFIVEIPGALAREVTGTPDRDLQDRVIALVRAGLAPASTEGETPFWVAREPTEAGGSDPAGPGLEDRLRDRVQQRRAGEGDR